MRKVRCLLGTLVLAATASAAEAVCPPGVLPVKIFYINGIYVSSERDAVDVASALEARLRIKMTDVGALSGVPTDCITVVAAYNQSHGLARDLEETALLLGDQEFIEILKARLATGELSPATADKYRRLISTVIVANHDDVEDLAGFVDDIFTPALDDGNALIIVGHSEGTLYANAAFRSIRTADPDAAVHLVAVATPSSLVEGDGPWTTTFEDDVINDFLTLLDPPPVPLPPPPKPANISNTNYNPCTLPVECHFFNAYLNGVNSGPKILTDVLDALLASVSDVDTFTWTQKFPATHPPTRFGHAMAYDATRREVVLFGGFNDDTWTWDGTNWTQKFPATTPPRREFHAMAYDATRREVVLFGGSNGIEFKNDTWTWDGTNWTEKFPATTPPTRRTHAMAYDATRREVVLSGGQRNVTSNNNDTWVWDGVNWAQKITTQSPLAPDLHTMVYDTNNRVIVLFGGFRERTPGLYSSSNETWVWDGTNWTEKFPATSPSHRWAHAMTYNAVRGEAVIFGGFNGSEINNETWTWDGTNWTQQTPAQRPSTREVPAMAYDEARSEVVLFGGAHLDSGQLLFLDDTWAWGSSSSPSIDIVVDGNPNDWNGITPLLTDPAGDGPYSGVCCPGVFTYYAGSDFTRLSVTNDATNVYLLMEFVGVHSGGIAVYLDTDQNFSTGCNSFSGFETGAEYVIFVTASEPGGHLALADYRDCAFSNDFPGIVKSQPTHGVSTFLEASIPIQTLRTLTPSMSNFRIWAQGVPPPPAWNIDTVSPAALYNLK